MTSFPFSGHAQQNGEEAPGQTSINDSLQNQESLLNQIVQSNDEKSEQNKTEANEGKEPESAPFVYLMNKAKYESMLEAGTDEEGKEIQYLRFPEQFSAFNKTTVFPFETVPNVFKINPPDMEDSD